MRHPSIAPPTGAELVEHLRDARRGLLACVEDLSDAEMRVPLLAIVNPFLWEIGHVAWFQEKWNLRRGGAASLRADSDALFDSAAVAHDTRWDLRLPSLDEVLAYLAGVLEGTCARLDRNAPSTEDRYFVELALYHEDMHVEALLYTRQTLALRRPERVIGPAADDDPAANAGPLQGDVEVEGGPFRMGAEPGPTFVFDNEKWAHAVTVRPFRLARAAVTQAEFAQFVEDGGYSRREWWSDAGWAWRLANDARHPFHWRREPNGRWLRRRFDRWIPLAEHRPVLHVNAHEADAFCRARGRRLPTEAEWEYAASIDPRTGSKRCFPWGMEAPDARHANLGARCGDTVDVGAFSAGDSAFGCRQMFGNVWEWTSSAFEPYPGFVADPYAEYSAPWFSTHRVLRGGAFVTQPRLLRATWRNFYTPERRDVWAGFRTAAV